DPVDQGRLTELVQDAFDRISAPTPRLTLSPGLEGFQLVGMPTFLAIDPDGWHDPPNGSVSAGEVSVTAWLEPIEVRWQHGTGETIRCGGPGNTYSTAVPLRLQTIECPYTYTTHPADHHDDPHATGYQLAATVVYRPGYLIEGLPGGPIEGTLELIDG